MQSPSNSLPAQSNDPSNEVVVSLAGTELVLLANRMAWWPDQKALLLADTHFGKAASFRQAGIPVPEGTTSRMLAEISAAIQCYSAEQLILLGDFIHSSNRAEQDYEQELLAWRDQHATVHITLVQGNHDKHRADIFQRLEFVVQLRDLYLDPFLLCHDPTALNYAQDSRFRLGGHIHPGFRPSSKLINALPCFWLTSRFMVFPAFGRFTGLARVRPGDDDILYAIYQDEIAKIHPSAE